MGTPNAVLTEKFDRAARYARTLFAGTVRKGTDIAYMSHLLAVAALVIEHGGSEDQAIAALLHDAAEDFGGEERLIAIEAEFGRNVAEIVRACSDSLLASGSVKADWWTRKVEYLARMQGEPVEALLISGADKLHNAQSIYNDYRKIGEELWDRFNENAGRQGSLWYYRRLAKVLSERLGDESDLGSRLRETVDGLFAEVQRHLGTTVDLEAEYRDSCTRAATVLPAVVEPKVAGFVSVVNDAAARGTASWLTGLGLISAVRAVREHSDDKRIPTPGIEDLDQQLSEAAADLVSAADLVLSVANGESELSRAECNAQVERCSLLAFQLDRATRDIAQLALGVTSMCAGTAEVMRLERAGVVALTISANRAAGDRQGLSTVEEAPLRIEIAGLLARLLTETEIGASWRGPGDDAWVEAVVNAGADLIVTLPHDPRIGWDAPVTIAEPARVIAAKISSWDLAASDIDVTVVAARSG